MSERGKSPTEAALDDLSHFMAGQRDFNDGVLFDKNKPPLWQSGYRTAIRNKVRDFGPDMITLKQRLLIERARPRFATVLGLRSAQAGSGGGNEATATRGAAVGNDAVEVRTPRRPCKFFAPKKGRAA